MFLLKREKHLDKYICMTFTRSGKFNITLDIFYHPYEKSIRVVDLDLTKLSQRKRLPLFEVQIVVLTRRYAN